MSITPAQVQLASSRPLVEQNQLEVLVASVQDAHGNPLQDVEVSLLVDHADYGGLVNLSTLSTDVTGMVRFKVTMRAIGVSTFTAHVAGSLASTPVLIRVIPSTAPPNGPRSWSGVVRTISRTEFNLNTVIAGMISQGRNPTKEEICIQLGLDYEKANDRNKVSGALQELKNWFDYLWRALYEPSTSYNKDYAAFMQDTVGFSSWKSDPNSPYPFLKSYYHLSENEAHELWVLSKMWDRFVEIANQYNLHLFVAYKAPDGWRYKQPNFWEYVDKQIWSASRLGKGIRTILTRHRDLGMILTSGESVHQVLEGAEDVRKMITDRSSHKIRCPMCSEAGRLVEFSTRDDWILHVKSSHLGARHAT